jgi:hypothetical protein
MYRSRAGQRQQKFADQLFTLDHATEAALIVRNRDGPKVQQRHRRKCVGIGRVSRHDLEQNAMIESSWPPRMSNPAIML